jgi:hypothetical protein
MNEIEPLPPPPWEQSERYEAERRELEKWLRLIALSNLLSVIATMCALFVLAWILRGR